MTLSSDELNLNNVPDRFQISFFMFPINNDRAGYQPWAMPVVLVVPYRYDPATNVEFSDSLPTSLRYYISDVPQQALVAGYDHRGILVPDQERFAVNVSTSELIARRIDLESVNFYRRQTDGSFIAIDYINAVEGDYIEHTLTNNTRGKIIYYPQTDYFDLSDISIATADLPNNRYRFIWQADFYRRNTQNEDFVCISSDIEPTIIEMLIACPGEIHSQMVENTPSVYFDNQALGDNAVVMAYRPFADALQDIFDEQSLLRKTNWIDEIPGQLVPYLSYLIGIDLPNFPGVSDSVRKAMVKNGYTLQRYKGTKLAIRELFEIFGFAVDITNVWYRANGSGFVAPGEQLPDDEQEDEIELQQVCQYDVIVSDFSEVGFGGIEVPLLYRPSTESITLHAYLVDENSATYDAMVDIISDLSNNLETLNSATCSTDTEGFYIPTAISTLLPSETIEGFGQVLIDRSLGATKNYTAGVSTISKDGTQFDANTSTLNINFDGYLDFKAVNTSNTLKLFIFAQYEREKIILPAQLENLRSNRFDLEIMFKSGEIISPNLFDFLINFVLKFKAFHSLLRKIRFNIEFTEIYQVTDWCVGGIHKQKPGTDAGEQQVPPAIIPIEPSSCETITDRGFKESDLEYRRKVLDGLEEEFEAWKSISKTVPDDQRALLESLSNITINTNNEGCGEVKHGQDRVETTTIDLDHNEDTRNTVCTIGTNDYCYKGRVEDFVIDDKYISLIDQVKCNPCNLAFGVGTYYLLPNGTKFDKLDLMIVSQLGKMIRDWRVNGALYQLYFSNRRLGKLADAFLNPAITDRHSIKVQVPYMHFPGHRFPTMGYIESDFTHTLYNAKPWDDAYSSLHASCKGYTQTELNPLNAELIPSTEDNQELIFDVVPLIYIGNGLLPDISSFGTHDTRTYQVTHAIYTTAGEGPLSGSGEPIVTLDGFVHITTDAITQNKLFNSWNSNCSTDYIDGYPAEADEYLFNQDEIGFNLANDVDLEYILELPSSDGSEDSAGQREALFKFGSGIICSDLSPPST